MSFTPYLYFQGPCAEAMTEYAAIFGSDDLTLSRHGEAPPGAIDGAAPGDRIMYAQLRLGAHALLASDFPEGDAGRPQEAVAVAYSHRDLDGATAIFARLSQGGTVTMPFAATFWSAGFGMVTDRFGTHWMISGPGPT